MGNLKSHGSFSELISPLDGPLLLEDDILGPLLQGTRIRISEPHELINAGVGISKNTINTEYYELPTERNLLIMLHSTLETARLESTQ